MYWLGIFF